MIYITHANSDDLIYSIFINNGNLFADKKKNLPWLIFIIEKFSAYLATQIQKKIKKFLRFEKSYREIRDGPLGMCAAGLSGMTLGIGLEKGGAGFDTVLA